MDFLEIDGSYGEGGGQILRTSLFLSTILGIPIKVFNVRIKRENPGLKRQHLHILKLLKKLAQAKVEGDTLGSTQVTYIPGKLKKGSYSVDFKSAGSITLFLQTILPISIFAKEVHLEIVGGTDVPMAPTADWFRLVYMPHLKPFCSHLKMDILKRGFYPAGGGKVLVSCYCSKENIPSFYKPKQGKIEKAFIYSISHNSLRERKVAQRQIEGALEVLKSYGINNVQYLFAYVDAPSVGTSIVIWIEDSEGNILGSDNLGRKGVLAEIIGKECAEKLIQDLSTGATVDRHLADHLVPWIALYGGLIKVPQITSHLETNVWVCNRVLGEERLIIDRDKKIVRHKDYSL